MMLSIQEYFDIIVRVESYFEENDTINRIKVDFIDGKDRISFKGSTAELEGLVDFLNKEIEKANKRKYIH